MTIAELHSNETLRREEFPVAREKVFLGHAGVCPLPRRVAEAVSHYGFNCTLGDQETLLPLHKLQQMRELAGKLINAQAEEIAFVGPTTLGLSYVANGLPLRKGDNILIYHDDYPSNVYPWMALAQKGVQVRFLNIRELGRIRKIDVEGQVDESTRLVALASCHFLSGWRIDVPAIGEFLRQRDILFCVDGIQTLGALPTPVEFVDFLAADAHKWVLGPCAAGILYVRKSLQERLRPPVYGASNVRCPNYVSQEEIVLRQDSRRYEPGTQNWLGLMGLHAAMELLLQIGLEEIAGELSRKREWVVPALLAKDYLVLNANAASGAASGIITFHHRRSDMAILHQRLEQAGVVTSLRSDRQGTRYIRLSPHFYNTDAELQRALELL